MAGYENIKDKGFDHRTTGELREITKMGGKASGESRRRKADFRKTLNQLLTAKIENDITPLLEAMGLESTLETAMLMAQINEAMMGNTKAAYFVAQYAGMSGQSEADDEEQKLDIEKKKAGVTDNQIALDESAKEMEAYFEQQKTSSSEPSVE